MNIIEVEQLGKRYFLQNEQRYFFGELYQWFTGRGRKREFWALRNLDMAVLEGESVGIIGENGAGKSTLLKILSQVTMPTEGRVTVRRQLASMLELGAGFHPMLTGRENIYLNGTIMGYDRKFISRHFDEIVDFSGIAEFIDQPVKNYSSGMYVRLGFSIAALLEPEILVVDEVLAVGDEEFQRRCKQWIRSFIDKGGTLLLVTHDLSLVRSLCSRAYWLKNGVCHKEGDIEQITSEYLMFVSQKFGVSTLSRGPLTLIFERGKLIIFWRGIEVTKNACLFTDIMASSSWQNSMDARWTILECSEHQLAVEGKWLLFPLSQKWTVTMESEQSFILEVEMTMDSDLNIRHDTVTLMLSELYDHWFTPQKTEAFPPTFHEKFGTRIVGVGQHSGVVGARQLQREDKSLTLPDISLEIIEPRAEFLAQATNTDRMLSARTLQFSRIREAQLYKRGERFTFKGRVRLEQRGLEADTGDDR